MKLPEKFKPRIVMTVLGVFVCSMAVGLFKCSLFGVDPFQCFAMGSWGKLMPNYSYGFYYMAISILFLIVDLFLDKHYIGIATFINLFLTGYVVDFSVSLINRFLAEPTMVQRVLMLAAGILIICFGSSLYMTADLGVSVYDAIAIVIGNRTPIPFRFARIICDVICVSIGTICVLAGAVGGVLPGIGTIITAFFMGPLIDFFNRKFSEPFLARR